MFLRFTVVALACMLRIIPFSTLFLRGERLTESQYPQENTSLVFDLCVRAPFAVVLLACMLRIIHFDV